VGEIVNCRLTVADDAGGGPQDRPHSLAMTLVFTRPTIMRMHDRNKVVNEIDRSDGRSGHPVSEAVGIQSRMANIQIESIFAFPVEGAKMPENGRGELGPKSARRGLEQSEQVLRSSRAQNSTKTIMLDHCLGPRAEMPEVGQADPVHAGGQATSPAAPDQPRSVQQECGVVGQAIDQGRTVRTVATGRIDELKRLRKRWSDATLEFET